MGAIIGCCSSCCDRTANKYDENYQTQRVYDTPPTAFSNTALHASDIYGINADDELAPSDNPATETIFRSILHPPKESTQQATPPFPSVTNPDDIVLKSANIQTLDPKALINAKPYRAPLVASSSVSPSRTRIKTDNNRLANANKSLKHSNSCSTIYIDDSTVSQPNLRAMIKCVSIAIHSHILHRKSNKSMDIFDEKLHPLSKDPVPDDYDQQTPDQKVIYRFIRNLFTAAQLTAECTIVTLVYLERVLSYGELDLCSSNWKRLVLGAIMLASKVWDDQAVWNVDFCQILKDITVSEMNELEREYIQILQFNVDVGSAIYAKYYFDLRQIAKENQISFSDELLTKEKAIRLEALSLVNNRLQKPLTDSIISSNVSQSSTNPYQKSTQLKPIAPLLSLRRSASVEFAQSPRKSLLILS